MTDPRSSGSPDRHVNGFGGDEPATGRFAGYNPSATNLDDGHAGNGSADEGYDWHAPQTLAPQYGEQSAPAGYGKSPEAWWDEVRGANGAGPDSGGYPAAFGGVGAEAPTNGYAPAAQSDSDHTAAIAAPPASTAPAADSADYGSAYNGYSGSNDERWSGAPGGGAQATPEAAAAAPSSVAGPRRARLSLRRIDPWSTLKFSLVLAVALFVVWMVAVGVLYGVLSGMGVFDKINSTVNDVNGSNGNTITAPIVLGVAGVVGGVSIVLFTALATVGSFIYNLCADMVGGLEVTLAERD